MKMMISVVVAVALALGLATSAYAQSSVDAYGGQGGQVQGLVQPSGSGPTSGNPSGTPSNPTASQTRASSGANLPFTGLDLVMLLAAGGVLVGAGFGMRRLVRAPESA